MIKSAPTGCAVQIKLQTMASVSCSAFTVIPSDLVADVVARVVLVQRAAC